MENSNHVPQFLVEIQEELIIQGFSKIGSIPVQDFINLIQQKANFDTEEVELRLIDFLKVL